MQTIRVVIDDALLRAADRAARTLKLNRSALIGQALARQAAAGSHPDSLLRQLGAERPGAIELRLAGE